MEVDSKYSQIYVLINENPTFPTIYLLIFSIFLVETDLWNYYFFILIFIFNYLITLFFIL